MSRSRRKLLVVLFFALAVPAAALYAIFVRTEQYEKSEAATPDGPSLLARAIEALGGHERLSLVRSVVSRTVANEAGRRTEARISIALPGRYRHDVSTRGARLVHASNGDTTWSTLDDVPVPVEEADLLRLEEQMAMVRCGLLVGLEEDTTVTITELGLRDGLDWLEVGFEEGDVGPFLLGFALDTAMLSRVEWKASMKSRLTKASMSVTFSDFRKIDGIMVGFAATISVDDEVLAKETIEEISFGKSIEPEIFVEPEPLSQSPIFDRLSAREQVVLLDDIPGDPADAERVVNAFIEELDINRNGPGFRDFDGERTVAVGLPVHLTQQDKPRAGTKGTPRFTIQTPHRILTTIVTAPDAETLRLAEQRLREHASRASLEQSGPIRHVAWKKSIVQVQLPVKEQ